MYIYIRCVYMYHTTCTNQGFGIYHYTPYLPKSLAERSGPLDP